jgi:hypothetical protein
VNKLNTKTKRKGKTTMDSSRRSEGNEGNDVNVVNEFTEVNETVVVQAPSAGEKALQQEFAQFLGAPDAAQKKILANLAQLHLSLRGPELSLDLSGYARPIAGAGPITPRPNQTTASPSTGSSER